MCFAIEVRIESPVLGFREQKSRFLAAKALEKPHIQLM
jgi:hypothetical protein